MRSATPVEPWEFATPTTGAHLLRVVDEERFLEGLGVAPRLAVAADMLDHAVEGGTVDGRVVSTMKALLEVVSSSSRLILPSSGSGASTP